MIPSCRSLAFHGAPILPSALWCTSRLHRTLKPYSLCQAIPSKINTPTYGPLREAEVPTALNFIHLDSSWYSGKERIDFGTLLALKDEEI